MNDNNAEIGLQEAREHALQAGSRLPRRRLSGGIKLLLWVLRIYVLITVPLVIYGFFHALHAGR